MRKRRLVSDTGCGMAVGSVEVLLGEMFASTKVSSRDWNSADASPAVSGKYGIGSKARTAG